LKGRKGDVAQDYFELEVLTGAGTKTENIAFRNVKSIKRLKDQIQGAGSRD
jgi:hypothetical protein